MEKLTQKQLKSLSNEELLHLINSVQDEYVEVCEKAEQYERWYSEERDQKRVLENRVKAQEQQMAQILEANKTYIDMLLNNNI